MTRTHDEAARLASDPATPLKVLHELAMNHPEVHPLLAENPSTYADLLTWLSGRGNPAVNAALARRAVASAEGTPVTPVASPADAGATTSAQTTTTAAQEHAEEKTAIIAPVVADADRSASAASDAPAELATEQPTEETTADSPGTAPIVVPVVTSPSDPEPDLTAESDAESEPLTQSSDPSPAAATVVGTGDDTGVEPSPASPAEDADPIETATAAAAAANVAVEDLPTSAMDAIVDEPDAAPATTPEPTSAPQRRSAFPAAGAATSAAAQTPPTQQMPANGASPARQSILGQSSGNEWNYGTRPTQRIQPQAPAQDPAPTFAPQQAAAPVVAPAATPAAREPHEPEEKRRIGMWVFLGLLAILLVLAILWALDIIGGGDRDDEPGFTSPTPEQTEPATEPGDDPATEAEPEPTEAEEPSGTGPEALGNALSVALADSTCTDPVADAGLFNEWVSAIEGSDSGWDQASQSNAASMLEGLQSHCNPGYALAVHNAQSSLSGLDLGGWLTPLRPVPSGAQEISGFSAPSGNIRCTLNGDEAFCTILNFNFTPPADSNCEADRPVTLVVGNGDARFDCSREAPGGQPLAYDTSATNGIMACVSRDNGVECWNTLTSSGFTVARAAGNVTPEEWGPGRQ